MNFSLMIKALTLPFIFFLSGCTSNLIDTMHVSCEPQPIFLEATTLPDATLSQLSGLLEAHGLELSPDNTLNAFNVHIKHFKLNLKALYQNATDHNLFRNIEATMRVAVNDIATGDLLWEKEYHKSYTLKTDPHFYSQNQLALAKLQWELQREIFSDLAYDLKKLCAIQTSGYS